MTSGLSGGSRLHEKPVQFDVTPEVVKEAAEGSGVGAEGSSEEASAGAAEAVILGDGEADAIVVGDVEAPATLQPATRPKAAKPTARSLMRAGRHRLSRDAMSFMDCPRFSGCSSLAVRRSDDLQTHGEGAR